MVTIIKKLATELAQCDYNELYELLETMSFVDAYNKLGGFNLQMDKFTNNNELLNIEVRFDYNFKHINGTIFQTKNGGCELGESVVLWLDDYSSPIVGQLDLCYKK